MPYFEVQFNGKKTVVGGAPDTDLLLLTVISSKHTDVPQLSLTGMKKLPSGKSEFIEWIREEVRENDQVKIVALGQATPTMPIGKSETQKPLNPKMGAPKNDGTKVGNGTAFEIVTSRLSRITTEIGGEESMQIVLTWHRNEPECRFEVDSLTVLDSGYTQGHHWIDGHLKPREWMELKVINKPL